MKNIIATTAVAFALTMPAFADGHKTSAQELFAMSNDSAAERIVMERDDTSTDAEVMAAELKLALGAMSAAERQVFFDSDDTTRMELVAAKRKLVDGDSAAETAAKTDG